MGVCIQGMDYFDCWCIVEGVEDNFCCWVNDNECDELGFGIGVCIQVIDLVDCGLMIELCFCNDSCEIVFDGVCNEFGIGDGCCEDCMDCVDCFGCECFMGINDYFFGYDDCVFMDMV